MRAIVASLSRLGFAERRATTPDDKRASHFARMSALNASFASFNRWVVADAAATTGGA